MHFGGRSENANGLFRSVALGKVHNKLHVVGVEG
jgi:hypothetical protein